MFLWVLWCVAQCVIGQIIYSTHKHIEWCLIRSPWLTNKHVVDVVVVHVIFIFFYWRRVDRSMTSLSNCVDRQYDVDCDFPSHHTYCIVTIQSRLEIKKNYYYLHCVWRRMRARSPSRHCVVTIEQQLPFVLCVFAKSYT